MTDIPTIASGTAPTAPSSDAGELGPAIAREAPASPKPAESGKAPPRGTYEQRRLAQDQAAAPTDKAPASPAADQQQPPATAGEKFKIGKYEVSEDELGAMMERHAVDDLKRATLPASAEQYEAKLPADLVLPGGQQVKFNTNDPSLIAARNMAHSMGLTQDQFSQILGVYAGHVAGQEAALAERSRAELEKVGINASQRVDAVGKWLDGFMGTADAKQIRALIVTDSMLRYHEAVMNKLTSQGSASFSQSHRVPAEDRTSIPGYERMSFEERRFAQDQQRNNRRR